MNNEFYLNFLDSSEKAIKKREESGIPNVYSYPEKSCFIDKNETAGRMFFSLKRSLDNLDEELALFENNFSNKYNAVYWSADYNDVFENLRKIIKSHKAKSVRLPNINMSSIFRELGIKYFLRDEKMELSEDGDIQFFVADMLLVDTGSILMLNQSNNVFDKLTNNKTNIFFTTIDRILGNTAMAEIYQQMATSNSELSQQEMLVFKGSPNCANYLFIIDNQRSSLLGEKSLRQALSCTQCKRCNEVCPIMQTIGDEPYNNVFTGPIANISLPFLETVESYKHVVYSCTLCGRCEEVCPLALPIRDMIVEERHILLSEEMIDKKQRQQLIRLKKFLTNRKKQNKMAFLKKAALHHNTSYDIKKSRVIPQFCKDSFNKSFQNK